MSFRRKKKAKKMMFSSAKSLEKDAEIMHCYEEVIISSINLNLWRSGGVQINYFVKPDSFNNNTGVFITPLRLRNIPTEW